MKYVVCLHLYIPWKFGERGSTPRGATRGRVCLFVCPSRYGARHRKPRQCVYTLNLGGTGISPPDKSPPGQKTPGERPPGQKHPRIKIPPAPDAQQAATYSIAAIAGNWTILVFNFFYYTVTPLHSVSWVFTIKIGLDWIGLDLSAHKPTEMSVECRKLSWQGPGWKLVWCILSLVAGVHQG